MLLGCDSTHSRAVMLVYTTQFCNCTCWPIEPPHNRPHPLTGLWHGCSACVVGIAVCGHAEQSTNRACWPACTSYAHCSTSAVLLHISSIQTCASGYLCRQACMLLFQNASAAVHLYVCTSKTSGILHVDGTSASQAVSSFALLHLMLHITSLLLTAVPRLWAS